MKYRWFVLFLVIGVVLTACRPAATRSVNAAAPTAAASARISLTARPGEVPNGSSTALAIQVQAGRVSTAEVAIKGSRAFVTNIALSETGNYAFTSPVITQDTIFVVTAKDATGATVATAETIVLVSTLPTEATATATPTPEPTTPTEPTPTEPTTPTEPAATPTEPAATPTEAAATPEPAQEGPPLPEGAVRVRSLEELQAATAEASTATTIMVAGTITCDADPCVRLKSGQTLMGEGGDAPAVLMADRTGDGNLTTVIELAPDVSVVGLEITGPDIYTAINGVDSALSGTVLIRNVAITSPTINAPLTVRDSAGTGTYTLLIDELTVAEATRPIAIANFARLEVTNSTFNLNIAEDSRGIIFQTGGTGAVLLSNVAVTSAVASDAFSPITFTNVGADGTLGVTISNTAVTFPNAAPEALALARSFNFETTTATGKIALQTPASTGNSTQATAPITVVYDAPDGVDLATVILGYIQGTLGDGSEFRAR